MSRCRSCNIELNSFPINPHTGKEDDLCYVCRNIVVNIEALSTREYAFQWEREGLKQPHGTEGDGNDDY